MADYEALRQRHLADAQAMGPAMVERLDWPEERLAEFRVGEVRRMIKLAKDLSPWHRERLAHVEPADVDEANLAELPAMTKADLMEHWDEIVTDDRLRLQLVEDHLEALTTDAYLFDRYHAIASGGSTGHRGVFVYDWDGWAMAYWTIARHEVQARRLDPRLAAAPPVSAIIAADHPTHGSSALSRTFAAPGSAWHHRLPVTRPVAELGNDLVAALGRLGLTNARITVATTDAVDRSIAGKLRRFVPLAQPGGAPVVVGPPR